MARDAFFHTKLRLNRDISWSGSFGPLLSSILFLTPAIGKDAPSGNAPGPNSSRRIFQAFNIPDYKIDSALAAKMREEIKILTRLSSNAPNRAIKADTLFRLATLHWEYGMASYLRKMERFNQEMVEFSAGQRSTQPKEPKFTGETSFKLLREVIQTDPNYDRLDEVYFLAGYQARELKRKDANKFFLALIKKFPNSQFRQDAFVELGDFYFDEREFDKAIRSYQAVLKADGNLRNYALYKTSWCYYNKQNVRGAMKLMQGVVKDSKGSPNEIDLRNDALRDLIIFYSDLGLIDEARRYFTSIGEPEYARKVIEKLAAIYFEQARYDKAVNALSKLISLDPYHEEAPNHHSKIIESYEKSEQLQRAMREMQIFLVRYQSDSAWARNNQQNQESISYTYTRSEVYARFLAKHHHEIAQKTEKTDAAKSKNYTKLAIRFYDDYAKRFASHKNAYDMRYLYATLLFKNDLFEEAANQYEAVAKTKEIGKNHKPALVGLMDSLSRLEETYYKKVAADLKDREKDLYPKTDLSQYAARLVNADQMFVAAFPSDPKVPKVLFQRAQLFYNYNQFEKAKKYFLEITEAYPQDPSANASRHLILDIYNIQKDWDRLEKTATAYLGVSSFATPENKKLLLELIQGSIFQKAKLLEEKEKFIEAAEQYESLAKKYPTSKYADKALYNAAVDYLNGNQPLRAVKTSKVFLAEHPKSPLMPKMILALATHFDNKLDYQNAAEQFEVVAKTAPDSKLASDALYNAALYREHLKEYNKALINYQAFASKYSDSPDAAEALFAQGVIFEKTKNWTKSIQVFNAFIKKYPSERSRIVEAHFRLGTSYQKLKNEREASRSFQQASQLGKKYKKGTSYASKALLIMTEAKLDEFKNIKFRMPQKVLSAAIEKKAGLLKQLRDKYLEVIDYGDAESGVEALYYLGWIYQDFSLALFNAPMPEGLTMEQEQQYQDELQSRAMPIEQKAIEAYEKSISKAFELKVYTEFTHKSYDALTQYKPDAYPPRQAEYQIEWLTSQPLADFQDKELGKLRDTAKQEVSKARNAFFQPDFNLPKNPEALRKVIVRYESAVVSNPRNAPAYAKLGDAYGLMNQNEKAAQSFENASLIRPNDEKILQSLAYYSLLRGNPRSIELYKELIRKDTQNWVNWNALASAYRQSKSNKEALSLIQKILNKNKTNVFAINNLGLLYSETDRFELAELTFQKAKKYNPKNAETFNNLGMVYIQMGLYGNAIREFEQAQSIDKKYLAPVVNLGNIYISHANFQRAVKAFEDAQSIAPTDPMVNLNLGAAYLATQQHEKAKTALEKVVTLIPTHSKALLNLGIIHLQKLKDPVNAIKYFDRFVRVQKNNIPSSHPVYNYLSQADNMFKAIEEKKAKELDAQQGKSK